MRKKILVIKGSSRKDSFTNRLWTGALKDFDNTDISVFDVFSESFAFCNGCNYCEAAGKCVHRDLDSFFEDFENADFVIFSSPVYNGSFSAPLKALIDRFQVYYTGFYKNGKLQQIKKFRKAVLVVAAGRKGEEALQIMEKDLSCALTILNMKLEGSVLCPYTDTNPDYEKASEELKKVLKRSLSDE